MSMAKPSNIFYVLRICETTTLRHLACSSPLEIPLFSAQTSNKPEPYIYGWEYIKNTLTKISSQWQREKEGKKIKRKRDCEQEITLQDCKDTQDTLSGEIKTDQNVIFKSLNLYGIVARKPHRPKSVNKGILPFFLFLTHFTY